MLKTSNYGAIALAVVLCCNLSGCSNAIQDLKNTSINSKRTKPISITGKVDFPTKFNTKAGINDIITNSTVSLIYPQDYQEANLRGKPIASGLSDNNGVFTINPAPAFDPVTGQIFILEATKRITPTSVNPITLNGGDAITLRTLVQWNGTFFKSITKNSIYLNSKTTALAIMSNFNTIKPEDTIEKFDVIGGETIISPITISVPNTTTSRVITTEIIDYVKTLVETSLTKDIDPIDSIYYQQQKFLLKDISAATINKLRGCISTNGNCNGISNNILTLPSLGTVINTQYLFRKDDIKVNTTTIGSQSEVSIAVNRSGDKVVTWVSNDGNGKGIYAQRYNPDGTTNGNEFKVNDDINGDQFVEAGDKSVAMSDDGSFMVIWTQPDINTLGVFAKKYLPNGNEVGPAFPVNITTDSFQNFGAISARGNGDYVVTWVSLGQDGDDAGIYARQFFHDGSSSPSEIPVNTTTVSSQFLPDVAVAKDGNFVVAWSSWGPLPKWSVYAQKFDANGEKVDSQIPVNDTNIYIDFNPSVGIDENKNFVISWYSVQDFTYGIDIRAKRFSFSSPIPLNNEFTVNNSLKTGDQANPKVAMNDSGQFVISWLDGTGNDGSGHGVHAKRFNTDGSPNGDEFIVNKFRRKNQYLPAVGLDNSGKYSIAWTSEGQDNSDNGIFMQNFDFSDRVDYSPITGNEVGVEGCVGEGGICLKGEQQVNSFTMGNQSDISIATNRENGNHVATWVSEYKDGSGNGIVAQLYNSSGQKQGGEIQVNGISGGEQLTNSNSRSVAMDNQGNFVVVWMSHESGNWQIRQQRFNSLGNKVGDEVRVNDTIGTDKMYASVSMNNVTGEYIITWSSMSNTDSWDIYAKKFNANGSSGSEFKVNTTSPGEQRHSDIYLADDGTYVIVWGSSQNNKWEIFGQRYNFDNSLIGSEFQINKDIGTENFNPTVIKDSTGKYIFTWHRQTGTSTNYDIIARVMNSSGVLDNNEFIVTNEQGVQGSPKIALLSNNNFVITWNDLSNADGSGNKVNAKMFDSNLTMIGSQIDVNSFKGNNQYTSLSDNHAFPKVASDKYGNFNIVWTSEGQDGSGKSVHIKRFDSNGTAK